MTTTIDIDIAILPTITSAALRDRASRHPSVFDIVADVAWDQTPILYASGVLVLNNICENSQ